MHEKLRSHAAWDRDFIVKIVRLMAKLWDLTGMQVLESWSKHEIRTTEKKKKTVCLSEHIGGIVTVQISCTNNNWNKSCSSEYNFKLTWQNKKIKYTYKYVYIHTNVIKFTVYDCVYICHSAEEAYHLCSIINYRVSYIRNYILSINI